MTLNQVIQRLSAIALAHKMIRSFAYVKSVSDYIFETASDKKVTYPICVVEHNSSRIGTTERLNTHTFRFYILDLINTVAATKANEQDVLSDAFSIAGDLIALVRDPDYTDTWFAVGDANTTMIADYTQDAVGGVAFDFPISTFYLSDRCQVPASALPADTIEIISTGKDWQLVQFENTTDSNTFALSTLIGKVVLSLMREDMPQVQVTTPTPLADCVTQMDKREFSFNSSTGTVTWANGNNLFQNEVITIVCK